MFGCIAAEYLGHCEKKEKKHNMDVTLQRHKGAVWVGREIKFELKWSFNLRPKITFLARLKANLYAKKNILCA